MGPRQHAGATMEFTLIKKELDHWSDPSGTESKNVQLNKIIDVR